MKNIFKFNNKALRSDGFHVPNGTLNDACGSKELNTDGFHGDRSSLNDRKRLMRTPLNDKGENGRSTQPVILRSDSDVRIYNGMAYGSKELNNGTSQRGRSMVEMLGVLAVIGVLSIGGIAAYRMAMEQITLNKVGEIVTAFGHSLVPDNAIYETLRLEDGKFDVTRDCDNCANHAKIDATLLFAETYGFKCPEETQRKYENWNFGCPVGNDIYFQIEPWENGDIIGLKFAKRSGASDDFYIRVTRRIHEAIKANPDLAELFDSLGGTAYCGSVHNQKLDYCFKRFEEPDTWHYGFSTRFYY